MDVTVLLEPELRFDELSRVLDELGFEGRLHTTRHWDKRTQAMLFEAAKGKLPIDLDFLVPAGTEGPVRHHGTNTLPLFSHFEKRFAKIGEQVVGYNHSDTTVFTGPGYFSVRASEQDEGELLIDYTQLPKERAEGWPEIVPNSARLGRFVFEGMVDQLRALSSTVSIGRAIRHGKPADAWFVLVRQDPAE